MSESEMMHELKEEEEVVRRLQSKLKEVAIRRDKCANDLSRAKKDLEMASASKNSYLRVIDQESKAEEELLEKLERSKSLNISGEIEDVRFQIRDMKTNISELELSPGEPSNEEMNDCIKREMDTYSSVCAEITTVDEEIKQIRKSTRDSHELTRVALKYINEHTP